MTLSPRRAASYRLSLRLLLSPARLRESLTTLQPQPSLRNATIAGAQVALALVLIAAALHPSPWQHVLGFACLGALAALFGRCATVAQRRRIVLIAGALLLGPVAVLSWLSWLGLPTLALLLALAAITGVIAALAHRLQTGVPGAVIFIFAASAALSPVSSLQLLLERCIATALGVAVAWVLCLLTDRLRDISALPAPPTEALQHRVLTVPSPGYAPRQALRVALCAALASGLAYAAGWPHPAWAAIGAVAVQQGAHLPGTAHRAWQRTLGTLVGAALAWAFLSAAPSFWTVLLAAAVLQICTEMTIGMNYALGQIFVTPMALLMTTLAVPGEAADMALARILDTVLGAGVGTVLALAFSSVQERIELARHHRRMA